MKRYFSILLTVVFVFALVFQANATAPTVQSRYLAFSNVGSTSADISFTRGNGAGRIVVVHYGGTVDWSDFITNYLTPLDNTGDFSTLTDAGGNLSTALGDADNYYSSGGNTYVVIDILTGTQRTSSFSNLSSGTTYNVRVFEYNISGTNADFNTNTATNNPRSFTTFTLTPPSGLSISQWSEGGLLSWSFDGTNAAGYKLTILLSGTPVSGYDNLDIGKPSDQKYPIFGLTAGQSYTYSIRSYDNNGNLSSAATGNWTTLANPGYASVTFSPGHGSCAKIGDVITATLTAQNNQWGLVENTTSTINGQTATFTDNGDGTYTFTYTVASGNTDRADNADVPCNFNLKDVYNIAFSSAYNGTGNASSAPAIDANAPTVDSVTSTTSNGTYGIGESINIRVYFNENVTFTSNGGQAKIELETGTTDEYGTTNTYQTGNQYIDLSYTVQEGDQSLDLDYTTTTALSLTGGATIKDACGNNAVLTLPTPGDPGSLSANKEIKIDGVRPTVLSINLEESSDQCTNANSVTFRVTFSEIVDDASVTTEDFTITNSSGSGATITSVTPVAGAGIDDDEYDVVVSTSGITGTAQIRLDFTGSVNDLANNASPTGYTFTAGQTYQIDHADPSATITSPANTSCQSNVLSITGTCSDVGCGGVSQVEVALWVDNDNSGSFNSGDYYWNGSNWTTATSPYWFTAETGTNLTSWTFNNSDVGWPSSFSEGRIYVQTRTTDGAGNVTQSAVNDHYFIYDNTAPSIAVSYPTSGTYTNGSQTLNFSVTEANSYTVEAKIGSASYGTVTTSTPIGSVNGWSSVTDGSTFTIDFQVTDCAGNVAITSVNNVTKDVTAPSVTSVVRQSPSGPCTNASSVTFRVTFSENINTLTLSTSDFTLTTTGTATGTISSITTITANTVFDVTVTGVSGDGTIRLDVNANAVDDPAGNHGPTIAYTSGETYTIDNTAPVISVTYPTSGTYTNGTQTLQFTITDANPDQTQASFDNSTWTNVSSGSSTIQSITGWSSIADGDIFTLYLKHTDCAGNEGTISVNNVTKDVTAPSVTSVVRQSPSSSCTNASSVTFRVTFSEDINLSTLSTSDFTLTTTGTATGTISSITTITANTVFDVTVTGVSGDGTIRLDVNANAVDDPAGNHGPTSSYTSGETYTIDNTAPVISVTYPTSGISTNGTQTLQFTITDANPDQTQASFDNSTWTNVSSGSSTILSIPGWSNIGDGATFTLYLKHTDCAGNEGTISIYNLHKDVTAPVLQSFTLSCDNQTGTATFSEGVYTNNNATGSLNLSTDLTITKTGGIATYLGATINHTAGSSTATFNLSWSGTFNGNEIVTLQTVAANQIFDAAGNALAHPSSKSDTAYAPIVINSNPSDYTTCANGNATFSATGYGGLKAKLIWRESTNNGNTWHNVIDGGTYSGATTGTLSLASVPYSYNGYKYHLVIYNGCYADSTTNATLNVVSPSLSGPSNGPACYGSVNNTFTATAVGGAPYTFTWEYFDGNNWNPVSKDSPLGANYNINTFGNQSTLTITGTNIAAGTYQYRVSVTTNCGNAGPSSFTLTVNPLPDDKTVSAQNSTVCVGSATNIIVQNSQLGVDYQLRIGTSDVGDPVAGTGSDINLPTGNLTSNTTFNVLATNTSTGCSLQLTNTPTVIVEQTPTAPTITKIPNTTSVCAGTDVSATFSSGSGGNGTETYEYRYDGTGSWFTYTPESNLSTTGHTLVEIRATRNASVCTPATNSVSWTVTSGLSVGCSSNTPVCQGSTLNLSANPSGGSENYSYSWTGPNFSSTDQNPTRTNMTTADAGWYVVTVTDNVSGCNSVCSTQVVVNTPPSFTAQPTDGKIIYGYSGTVFTATDNGATSYQWYRDDYGNGYDGNPVSGATSASFSVSNAQFTDDGRYYLAATNDCGTTNSNYVRLKVAPTQGSGISLISRTNSTLRFSWTRGNGDGILITAKAGTTSTTTPIDGSTYTANSAFGSGDDLGSNTYAIYNGTGTSMLLTGLTNNSNYTLRLFEYKNATLGIVYNENTSSNNPRTFKTLPRDFGEANFKGEQFALSEISPNPVADGEVSFFLISPVEAKVTIEIVNSQGNVLSTQEYLAKEGVNDITIFLYNLQTQFASGLYFVRVSGLGETLQQPFIYLP